jgi:hypothetical protein
MSHSGEERIALRQCLAIAALVAIGALAPGTASATVGGEVAAASTAGLGGQRGEDPDVNEEPSLGLFVSPHPEAYKRATIRAQGVTDSPLRLWVYENLRGGACSATPAEREPRPRTVIAGLLVDGVFDEQRRPRMKNPGRHTYCAYLGPDEGTAYNRSFTIRRVRKPHLRAGRAGRTVATALRRHRFANRVIENLQQSCGRRSRSEFQCRFSSAFPGYSLTGRGSVELKRKVSYRFQVSVRGRSFVLTDESEGSFPG